MQKEPRQYGKDFQLRTQAAVWTVAAQLALRGHVPLFPGLDVGYDLVLDNGLRLQIKSSMIKHQAKQNYPFGAYGFQLLRGAWDSNAKKYKRSNLRPYSEVADFFVLWGIDENRFFILPTANAGKAIWFGRKGFESKSNNRKVFGKITEQRLVDMEDRWDLLNVSDVKDLVNSAATEIQLAQKEN